MTVESSLSRAQYATNATTGPWTVPFYFLEAAHLSVIYTDADGDETTLTLTTHYSVTGAGDENGGTVTTVTAYASGGYITILRDVPATQETDYTESDAFPAASHELALDRLTMLVQQALEVLARALVFAPSDTTGSVLPAAAARASKLLGFDSDGVLSMNAPTDGTAASLALLLASSASNTEGAGMVGFDPDVSYAAGTVGDALLSAPRHYTPQGGGVTDELATMQAAVDAAYGGVLMLSSGGTYLIDGELEIDEDIEIITDGALPAVIVTDGSTGIPIDIGGNIAADATTTLAANARIYSRFIEVASATGIAAGQLLKLQSNKAWYIDAREQSDITPSGDAAGTAVSGTTTTMVLEVGATYAGFVGKSFTIESGTNAGFAREVTAYDSGTRTATFAALPSAIDNTSVYRFPELLKGELHKVRSINGTTVELEDPLFDGYDVVDDVYGDQKEVVTITVYTPLKVKIDNLRIERPALNGANGWLMRMSYCAGHEVTRFGGVYGSAVGIQDVSGYRGRFSKLDIAGSNDTTTGYGVQLYGCTFASVKDSDFAGCRRGVDVSGLIPSNFCDVSDNRNHGGGEQEDGQAYYPEGTVANYGFGSHGTARGTTFMRNGVTGVHTGINLRGRDEKILSNQFHGEIAECCVSLFYGFNTIVKGNVYQNLYSEGALANSSAQTETASFEATNINGRVPQDFIQHSFARERGFLDVSDNVVWGVRRYFLAFPSSGTDTWSDISVRANRVHFTPGTVSDEVALIGTDTGTVELLNLTLGGNEFTGGENLTNLYRLGTDVDVADAAGAGSRYGDTYVARVYAADDAVAKIRVGQTGAQCRFELYAENATAFVFNGLLEKESTTMVSMGVQTLVLGIATVPTGTDGTDGRINCHYSGTWLYIENRSGGLKRFHVTIHPMS